ncbi:MAG: flagellar basal body rod protein FlgC [Ignavibacteriae bacterium]|nr:flagellar basal body rod protein FlgC [Ignavibacteriota bacterium]
MKISPNFSSFNMSAKGMSIQKRKMDLVAENMANSDTTKTKEGIPYQRKYLVVKNEETFANNFSAAQGNLTLKMARSESAHLQPAKFSGPVNNQQLSNDTGIESNIEVDKTQGNLVYMPDHPDASNEGYVELPNVNVVNEMVEMISATRSYEANLTAFNSSKQIAKDSLEI